MDRAINAWVATLDYYHGLDGDPNPAAKLKLPYTIYGCMLLLSHSAFTGPSWDDLVWKYCNEDDWDVLYRLLAEYLKITHIAINKPIPLDNSHGQENVLRAPQNFTPLYGDFGPTTCSSPPTQDHFDAAFWVTAKQNDVYQTWAPRWTMFSRGNISEKARLLALPSVLEAVGQGREDGRGCAAVDLYAGIGYFAFSYLKTGVGKVVCCDINAWSIEGLRRGAVANKWEYAVCGGQSEGDVTAMGGSEARLLIFQESNEHAASRVLQLRDELPPVRHVNCGLLPTSRDSWQTAVEVLDREQGGWIHVHENFGLKEVEKKAEGVRAAFQDMLRGYGRDESVHLDGTHQVKSYAPGVMHCVLDIYIPPSKPS